MSQSLSITPSGPIRGALAAPSSKSATNRALVLAALAEGTSTLRAPLESDDTLAMIGCLRGLGVEVSVEQDAFVVTGSGGALRAPSGALDASASGTTMRFLTAVACLARGPSTLTGTPALMARPIGELVRALHALGARVSLTETPPVRTDGGGLEGGAATLDASASSQFATAILLVAPYARHDVTLTVEDLGASGFVEMTVAMMREWGASVEPVARGAWRVRAPGRYLARDTSIEYDASAAAHLFALAVATGGEVTVDNVADTLQPDAAIVEVFEEMGARVGRTGSTLTVAGPASIAGVDVDLHEMPDQLPTIAALAALGTTPSRITGVAITRGHETDRIAALATELTALGVTATELPDGLSIQGPPTRGARLSTHDDHRLAMAFASIGAAVPGVVIEDPGCVAKTYPGFWDDAARLGLRATV
jgi:3-phosphoshikimate 1-carboxyvinyltransferase